MVVAHIGHHVRCLRVQLIKFLIYPFGGTVDFMNQLPWEFAGGLPQIVYVSYLRDESHVSGGCGPFSLLGYEAGRGQLCLSVAVREGDGRQVESF